MLPGGSEILVIIVLVLIIFGPKDLVRVIRTMGAWYGKFQRLVNDARAEINQVAIEDELLNTKSKMPRDEKQPGSQAAPPDDEKNETKKSSIPQDPEIKAADDIVPQTTPPDHSHPDRNDRDENPKDDQSL